MPFVSLLSSRFMPLKGHRVDTYLCEGQKLFLARVVVRQLIIALFFVSISHTISNSATEKESETYPLALEVQPCGRIATVVRGEGGLCVEHGGVAGFDGVRHMVEVGAERGVPERAFAGGVEQQAFGARDIGDGVVVRAGGGPVGVGAFAGVGDHLFAERCTLTTEREQGNRDDSDGVDMHVIGTPQESFTVGVLRIPYFLRHTILEANHVVLPIKSQIKLQQDQLQQQRTEENKDVRVEVHIKRIDGAIPAVMGDDGGRHGAFSLALGVGLDTLQPSRVLSDIVVAGQVDLFATKGI
ncbi:hypothetical protein FH972_023945 [Carpinus fangiana]|uniref:Uncharacterized protein n=1 Tax=Carpinus fangiana TaxID=176857 RepID=A0A5N6KX05_9ROSI|nr:hypothetical protein FH972_023945 [Carpinus fangiana]